MWRGFKVSLALLMGLPVTWAAILTPVTAPVQTTLCEFYNATCFIEAYKRGQDPDMCHGNDTCPTMDSHSCYAVWSNDDTTLSVNVSDPVLRLHTHRSGLAVKMMGCILTSKGCHMKDKCVETKDEESAKGRHLFCCCHEDLCNQDFQWQPIVVSKNTSVSPDDNTWTETMFLKDYLNVGIMILSLVLVVVVVSVVLLVVYKKRKVARRQLASADADHPPQSDKELTSALSEIPDQLEFKAQGRYGEVYKAKLGDKWVAVKAFGPPHKQSWLAEQEIYQLPRLSNENILKFIGVNTVGSAFWLVTEFHERGSLCDFLKSNTVTWEELCKIAGGIANGLSHLHEELPPSNTEDRKLAVAHRDFKSKNVLIKNDLTPCIADFGLALIFEPDKPVGDTHGQVGTRRYMAPEVLEGAITFSRDSFLRIDMYACGLVLWELASRCRFADYVPNEYKLPFEEEVSHATDEQMLEVVVHKKMRPVIPPSWVMEGSSLKTFVLTMTECWDQDAEARLSASTIKERIKDMCEMHSQQRLLSSNNSNFIETINNSVNSRNIHNRNVLGEQHELMPLISQYMSNSDGSQSTLPLA